MVRMCFPLADSTRPGGSLLQATIFGSGEIGTTCEPGGYPGTTGRDVDGADRSASAATGNGDGSGSGSAIEALSPDHALVLKGRQDPIQGWLDSAWITVFDEGRNGRVPQGTGPSASRAREGR